MCRSNWGLRVFQPWGGAGRVWKGRTPEEEGGLPTPGLSPPAPADQSDHRGKKRNLPLGTSGRAIFGTQTFAPPPPPPPDTSPGPGRTFLHRPPHYFLTDAHRHDIRPLHHFGLRHHSSDWPMLFVIGASGAVGLLVALWIWLRLRHPPPGKRRVLVVLGSGGHTTEMFYALRTLEWSDFQPSYVVADTDAGSARKAAAFEAGYGRGADLRAVPRAREVGQSYATSAFTTLWAFWRSLSVVWAIHPAVIVCNGPGTCIPIAFAGLLYRALGLQAAKVVYSESFTCIAHLSLSGKILYPLADAFAVEWPQLRARYPRAVWAGRRAGDAPGARDDPPREYGDYVLVTVGSTVHDDLLQAIDCAEFLEAVQGLGFRKVRVQHGATVHQLRHLRPGPVGGVDVRCFAYDPDVPRMIAEAGLVVSHAGAGSILDALCSGARMVVVPNERLMNNHQVQLAQALAAPERRYVVSCSCSTLLPTLQGLRMQDLRPYPKAPSPAFAELVGSVLKG